MTRAGTSFRPMALLLAAGLVLGSLVTGLVRAADPNQPSGKKKAVKIPLVMTDGAVAAVGQPVSDDKKSKGKVVVLSKKQNHYAEWVTNPSSADVTLTIGMKANNPHPFEGPFTSKGNTVSSTKLLKTAEEKTYEYWVNVHDNKTGKDFKLDPDIRVDP